MTSKISDVKAFSVSYMGGRGCGSKPAWMGAGVSGMMVTWAGGRGEMIVTIIITFFYKYDDNKVAIMGLGSLLFSLPHFLTGTYRYCW